VELGVEGSSYTQVTSGLAVGQQVQLDLSATTSTTSTTGTARAAGAGS
jgi:hypothetical protein